MERDREKLGIQKALNAFSVTDALCPLAKIPVTIAMRIPAYSMSFVIHNLTLIRSHAVIGEGRENYCLNTKPFRQL
jgi:hypothetical protein